MKVIVKCFSQVRYHLGKDELVFHLEEGVTTSDLEEKVREQAGDLLEGVSLRVAVNQKYTPEAVELKDGDEVALIPPVQGG
ncbi:MAG: MoaD/ThiS family protein [Candidatus Marinimicrobia bacterium]|jgi:molybdopterin converting factor small subunit|nr:MoaD/ThiS family protein [Candidatus Neomarinimicrobiota bacterium]MDP6568736.1 MoaD/ThiS family protein [Candidatus Neomarinimicrobiota bacterium]MDP7025593.1 MoaD/ThiS family protein [Candidatus Neomarinimicrobiota bacterium]|tara:strand:+ start:1372 stop:1614 length:243 start_codon:yes stop_codon:yes gene_type:complete